jgi:hypothetical protein
MAEPDDSDAPDDDIDLVTVAQFSDPLKANVLRACLESNGIFAYVWASISAWQTSSCRSQEAACVSRCAAIRWTRLAR